MHRLPATAPNTDAKMVKSVIKTFREKYRGKGREEILFEIQCDAVVELGSIMTV